MTTVPTNPYRNVGFFKRNKLTNTLDKYYTKPSVAQNCIDMMLPYTDSCTTYIEPSAGSGVFIRDFTTLSYDLFPERQDIHQGDWLELTLDLDNMGDICVYGNPPYGKRNNLSKAFIRKSCSFAKVVAFVLPAVYNKYTLQKAFPKEWKLVKSAQLPPDSFTEFGQDYHIPSVFQVWAKESILPCLRDVPRTVFENKHFSIVGKSEGDIYVMGAAPHNVKEPEEVIESNRGYWIKCHIAKDAVSSNFKSIKWVGNSSASGGVAWHTKSEIMNTYEDNYNDSHQGT